MRKLNRTDRAAVSLKNNVPCAYYETKRHTDTLFAFNVYPCTIPQDFASVPLHWQDSVEIIYIKNGEGTVQVDSDIFHAVGGDIFFVLPGHVHGLRNIARKRMEYENIIFDMSFLGSDSVDICSQKYFQPILGEKIQLPVYIGKNHAEYERVSACLDAADLLSDSRVQGYELGVKGQMMILFSVLIQASPGKKAAQESRDMQKLKKILAKIEQDYDKKLTVTDAAVECGYSTSHFMRWFREMTGTGFAAYLNDFRLERAAFALRSSDDTVLEIAGKAGFSNLSNFNRQFKKKFEMCPGVFRKKYLD